MNRLFVSLYDVNVVKENLVLGIIRKGEIGIEKQNGDIQFKSYPSQSSDNWFLSRLSPTFMAEYPEAFKEVRSFNISNVKVHFQLGDQLKPLVLTDPIRPRYDKWLIDMIKKNSDEFDKEEQEIRLRSIQKTKEELIANGVRAINLDILSGKYDYLLEKFKDIQNQPNE